MAVLLALAALTASVGINGLGTAAIVLFFAIHAVLRRWVALGGAALLGAGGVIWIAVVLVIWSQVSG
jgi:hypothetical protein